MAFGEGSTKKVAEFAFGITYENLPPDVIHQTKRFILDVIGCTLGGYPTEMGTMMHSFVTNMGGNPQATIIGSKEKTSCVNAALVNGCMANALDMDDTFMNCSHPGVPVVHAIIPIAEQLNASGKMSTTVVSTKNLGREISSFTKALVFVARHAA